MEEVQGRLDRLREAANESARSFRTAYTFYLIVALYILVIVSSTHQELLFRAGDVQMPIVNVGVPVVWFFTVVPWLLVLLHFNLLIQAIFLANKVNQYAAALKGQIRSRNERSEALGLLYPAPLAHKVADADQQGSLRGILNVIVFVTLAVLPPAILIFAQVRFLPYQNELLTWLHRVAVVIDIGLLWWLWPRIAAPHVKWRVWLGTQELKALVAMARRVWLGTQELKFLVTMAWRVWHRTWGLKALAVVFVGLFSVVIADFPGGTIGNLTSFLDPLRNYLGREYDLSDRVLVHEEPSPEILAAHYRTTCESRKGCDESVIAVGSPFWCKHAKPLQLKNRNFKNANLFRSTLCRADLRAAKLHGADLRAAKLHGADLMEAELYGADLTWAKLYKADLKETKLHGASLGRAELHGADLWRAEFNGAYLREAQLRGVNMRETTLDLADLRKIDLSSYGPNKKELEEARQIVKKISSPKLRERALKRIQRPGYRETIGNRETIIIPFPPKDFILFCKGDDLHKRLQKWNVLGKNFVVDCQPEDKNQLSPYYKKLGAYLFRLNRSYEYEFGYVVKDDDLVHSDEYGYPVAKYVVQRRTSPEACDLPSWKRSGISGEGREMLRKSYCEAAEKKTGKAKASDQR